MPAPMRIAGHAPRAIRNAFFSPGFRRFGPGFSRDYLRFAWRAARQWGHTGPGVLQILGFRVEYMNQSHALLLLHEVFVNCAYAFESLQPRPRIVDCGANIGMSVVFFKRLYPDATVLAFEPDESTFGRLRQTVESNGLTDVRLVNAAVAERGGTVAFYASETADGSLTASMHPSWGGTTRRDVRAVRLSEMIDGPVDFLKVDVEGAEYGIVRDLVQSAAIAHVRQMRMEYHAVDSEPGQPGRMIEALEATGMRVSVRPSEADSRTGLLSATRP